MSASIEITGNDVAEGLYAWLQKNQWCVQLDIAKADLTKEAAAQQALLILALGDIASFQRLPHGIQCLAARFLIAFLTQVMGPSRQKRWMITATPDQVANPQALAWLVIAQEIAGASPRPSMNH